MSPPSGWVDKAGKDSCLWAPPSGFSSFSPPAPHLHGARLCTNGVPLCTWAGTLSTPFLTQVLIDTGSREGSCPCAKWHCVCTLLKPRGLNHSQTNCCGGGLPLPFLSIWARKSLSVSFPSEYVPPFSNLWKRRRGRSVWELLSNPAVLNRYGGYVPLGSRASHKPLGPPFSQVSVCGPLSNVQELSRKEP